MPIERLLHHVPFFSQLSSEEVDELASRGRVVSMSCGEIVCREGEASDSMYVLLSGEVSVYRHDSAGRRVDLRQFGVGDHFGEIALLDSKPRTATVACLADCELFVLERTAFRDLLTASPSLVVSVLRAVADRAREHSEEHYRVGLANLALEAQAEIERHRSLTRMVAGVAHELNTPLGITNTAVDMLANRLSRPDIVALFESSAQAAPLLDNMVEAITLAQRNITRAHQLIQDFKKVAVDQLVDTPQKEDLPRLVATIVDLFKVNARQAHLVIEIDDRLPDTAREWYGYPGRLSQVILNLLTNIERYAYDEGNGGKVDIILSAESSPPAPTFTITVRDHGRGIARADLDKVFEPFHTTGRGRGGTGLGLSIVRNTVTVALKGAITLDSTPGRGTTFQITFPQEV